MSLKGRFPAAPTVFQVLQSGDNNPKRFKRIIYGQAISDANGVATLYFTDNGLATGNPLLTSIDYVGPSVYSTNASTIARPRVQMREKNVSGKYVSANVTNISGVVVLSITVLGSENPVNGAVVEFMIMGSYDV
ncbi:hypothetical protein CN899_08050 [Bacillus thuringiensis]|uniref:Uncharacterized protein n=1 Tax=Bacillus thuringiensis TaxID=1428 RepID=A0A9X7C2K1_BACTU|nr:hypothetical protein [Bacillus thuringiensis]PGH85783.1 hypothetical protein CN899_08050 [Bacillus thuringiensis]